MVLRVSLFLALFWSALWSINFYIFPDTVHHRLPSSGTCQDIIGHFFESPDLFTKYPEIQGRMSALVDMDPDFPSFYKQYYNTNKKAPTLRDAFIYMYSLRQRVLNSYDEIILEVESLNQEELAVLITELKFSRNKLSKFKELDHIANEIQNDFKAGSTTIESLDIPIPMKDESEGFFRDDYFKFLKDRTTVANYYGEYGELLVVGKTREKVITRGLLFEKEPDADNIYGLAISDKLSTLENKLQSMNNDEIKNIVLLYGDGLLRHAKEYLDEAGDSFDHPTVVTKIMTMLYSKEIDLVAESAQGKMIWGEVKAYRKPITLETLTGKGHGKKTMLDQLIEHRALRDILGLAEDVKLRFVSPLVEIEPDARVLIEQAGYEVLTLSL